MRISLWLSSTPSQPGTGLLRSIIQKGTWGRPTTLAGTGPVGWDPHITLFSFKNDFTPASLEEENGIIEDLIQRTRAIASDPKLFSGSSSSSWVTSTPFVTGGSSEKAPMATFYSLPIGFSAVRKGSSYFQSVLLEVASASAAPANAPLFDLRKAARDHYASIGGPSDNDQFYPHLSLHYGVEESIREHIFQALTQHDLPAETLSSLRFVGTHLQLVKTTEDVAQWVSLASVPLCTSTSSPSAASIVLRNAMFVGGRWVTAKSGSETQVPVVNPATREVITLVPGAKAADVDEAARKAHEAFEGWSSTTGKQRAVILRKIAKEIMDRKEELAWLETLNNGKPYREAIEDIQDCSKCFSYYADRAEELDTEFGDRPVDLQEANEAFSSRVKLEAVGPCGMIIPWNYPLLMAAWKVAPALAAGCSMVLKPSEMTPLTALELAAIAQRAGLPAGVLNVITGYGPDAGAPIASHPLLSKVAFTGSVATGKRVYQAATESVKRLTLELGGKSPIIIFDDVDIDKTVEWMMVGIFFNQGQVCSATSRAIVHESIADKLIARFVEAAKKLRLGDGLHPETTLGPLINETQYKKVLDYIETGKREGAKLVCGGLPEKADELKGYFVAPTVFTGTEEGMTIWKEEIFGPVLSVKTFSTEEEALRLANNTHFGLAAAVMSKDKERCNRVASKLEAGIVWINCSQPTFIQAPWGGKKASGIGRELGPWGLMNYLEVKQMTSYESPEPYGWYNI